MKQDGMGLVMVKWEHLQSNAHNQIIIMYMQCLLTDMPSAITQQQQQRKTMQLW